MNICIPVTKDAGGDSRLSGHFGSAPFFAFADTASGEVRTIPNGNQHHAHGRCQPMRALAGEALDAVVVRGIGAGALSRLRAMGLPVHRAAVATVADAVAAFNAGELAELAPDEACELHGHGHGHGHGGGRGHRMSER